jgi:hypothetical protein
MTLILYTLIWNYWDQPTENLIGSPVLDRKDSETEKLTDWWNLAIFLIDSKRNVLTDNGRKMK